MGRAGPAGAQAVSQWIGGRVSYAEKVRLLDAAGAGLGAPRLGVRPGAAVMKDVVAMPLRLLARIFDLPTSPIPVRKLMRRFPRVEHGPGRGPSARHRLQVLEEATSDLLSSAPVEELLDRIAARADSAVHAPGLLLAVRLPTGDRHLRTHGTGAVLEAALADDGVTFEPTGVTSAESVLSVPVTSGSCVYGMLAVVAGPGQEFTAGDTSTLGAYARHAAAVLQHAGLRVEARENSETSELLLGVARSLAEGSSVQSVATAIAEAVPNLSGATRSAVALWDAEAGRLRIAGMSGWYGESARKLAEYGTTAQESPELAQLLSSGLPAMVNRKSSAWARDLLDDFDIAALAGIPILSGDQISGIVLAHWPDEPTPEVLDGALTERLAGLACLAAVALDKARLLEDARRQALHDPLTGLPNRTLLETRLEAALVQAGRDGRRVGLVFCDVNRFKRINDSLGHGAGDSVLRHVAAQLQTAVRATDTVSRYSGDEFVILLPDLHSESEAVDLTARVRASLTEPLDINGRTIFVDVAIGTSVSDALQHGVGTPSEAARLLVEEADFQMYRSKALRRGQRPPSRCKDNLRLETDLRGAVSRGELLVHYQPQIDVTTDRVVAAEALVRWQHPELGLIPPGDFIALAEESELITGIGAYVLAEACRAGADWRAAGHEIEVSVNISAVQLGTPDFTVFVRDTLQVTGFPAAALTLEVTESQAVSETIMNDSTLCGLRSLGVGISVDDFGTGYSSLAQLHRLPVTEVKIDRSFTARLGDEGPAFIAGIVGLGHGLGLRVVAEGVETPVQLEALRAIGCERAQGFLLGTPGTPTDLEEMLRSTVPRVLP